MAELVVVGVRHHSPACSRVVRDAIERTRPWAVLIEGPSDMNPRLGELLLPHTLPVALYSYYLPRAPDQAHTAQGSWAPFCAYSPEWIALREGHAVGARVRFMDLPAWDPAFGAVTNRYSDHERAIDSALHTVATERGFDSTDTLWDHLFEQGADLEDLARELAAYFVLLRGSDTRLDPAHRDARREAYMARWIDWALAAAPPEATVVAVCGGYHAPALRALVGTTGQRDEPTVPTPSADIARTGSYLVPFSFRRLDSFTGYASGMPSPAFYQAVWEHGDGAGEQMLFAAITRLRAKGQRVSTADAIAASELAHGLAQLRSHRTLARTDVLDGLAGALVKDALREPPPWTGRGVITTGADPYLVEILKAFSGEARGQLAAGTPRPPLVDDIEREIAAAKLAWTDKATDLNVDVFDPALRPLRQLLYRLRVLAIPGVQLTTPADLRRGRTRHVETWTLQRKDTSDIAMIEAAVYGATLEAAALARIHESMQGTDAVVALVAHLEEALRAGFHHLVEPLCTAAAAAVEREPLFANAGKALARIAAVEASEPLPAGHGIATLTRAVIERALWLLEAIDGPEAVYDASIVAGIAALRSALDLELVDAAIVTAECIATWTRRAAAAEAPPAVRGACVGALWTSADLDGVTPADHRSLAETTVRGVPSNALGDCLAGLFALARETFRASGLLDIVDDRLGELPDEEFLTVLPSLRRAFAFFPPRERRELAKRLLVRHRHPDGSTADASTLLGTTISPETAQRVRALEDRWFSTAARYALREDA